MHWIGAIDRLLFVLTVCDSSEFSLRVLTFGFTCSSTLTKKPGIAAFITVTVLNVLPLIVPMFSQRSPRSLAMKQSICWNANQVIPVCGALGRITRVFYRCIILRVFCRLLSISDDNLFHDVSVVVQRRSRRADYVYSLLYFSAVYVFHGDKFNCKVDWSIGLWPHGHAGIYVGRSAHHLLV